MNLLKRLLKRTDPDLVSSEQFHKQLTIDSKERREFENRLRALEVSIDVQSRGRLFRDN